MTFDGTLGLVNAVFDHCLDAALLKLNSLLNLAGQVVLRFLDFAFDAPLDLADRVVDFFADLGDDLFTIVLDGLLDFLLNLGVRLPDEAIKGVGEVALLVDEGLLYGLDLAPEGLL